MHKQPKALRIFFLTEMWERYGFYVIQTLLILYLLHVFKMSDEMSYGVLGSITALAYGNSVLGGFIADRWLGHRTAVLIASVMLASGYCLIAVSYQLTVTYWAFALITMGTGLFKPNICSLFGQLYDAYDVRRHSGFTYFYVGVNLGIILGESLAGVIQQYFGWHSVFFSAAFVLVITLIVFWLGSRYFHIQDHLAHPKSRYRWLIALSLMVAAIAISYYVIAHPTVALAFFSLVAVLSGALIIYHAYVAEGLQRRRLIAFLVLVAISTLYWAMYFQMFFSMNLFVDRVVDRSWFGLQLVPAVYPSIEAFGVIVVGPLLGWLWWRLESSRSRFNPGIPLKFCLGLALHTIAFGVMYLSSLLINKSGLVMPGWLILAYLFIAVSELLVMPVGLAMVSELLPQRLSGVMMGVFFISLGLGGKLAGVFATLAAVPLASLKDFPVMEHIYQHSFLLYFLLSLGVTVLCFSLVRGLNKMIALPQSG